MSPRFQDRFREYGRRRDPPTRGKGCAPQSAAQGV